MQAYLPKGEYSSLMVLVFVVLPVGDMNDAYLQGANAKDIKISNCINIANTHQACLLFKQAYQLKGEVPPL